MISRSVIRQQVLADQFGIRSPLLILCIALFRYMGNKQAEF